MWVDYLLVKLVMLLHSVEYWYTLVIYWGLSIVICYEDRSLRALLREYFSFRHVYEGRKRTCVENKQGGRKTNGFFASSRNSGKGITAKTCNKPQWLDYLPLQLQSKHWKAEWKKWWWERFIGVLIVWMHIGWSVAQYQIRLSEYTFPVSVPALMNVASSLRWLHEIHPDQ